MAYNSYFPATYPQVQMVPQTPPQAMSQPQNGIVWVQGMEGAKAYPVGAGNNVLLMDSDDSVFYIKSADQSGMPMPLRVFDYTERKSEADQPDLSAYVTHEELEKVISGLTPKKKKEDKNE